MVNTNIIGRITCPICGEPLQDLKVNKNGNLYCFCDNGCAVNLSGKMSKAYRPRLLAGENISAGKIGIITALKGKTTNERRIEPTTGTTTAAAVATASSAGNNTHGRTDGADPRSDNQPTAARRGLLTALFSDDGDE